MWPLMKVTHNKGFGKKLILHAIETAKTLWFKIIEVVREIQVLIN